MFKQLILIGWEPGIARWVTSDTHITMEMVREHISTLGGDPSCPVEFLDDPKEIQIDSCIRIHAMQGGGGNRLYIAKLEHTVCVDLFEVFKQNTPMGTMQDDLARAYRSVEGIANPVNPNLSHALRSIAWYSGNRFVARTCEMSQRGIDWVGQITVNLESL